MDWTVFIVYFAACCAAGATGALFKPGPWYEGLAKPSWTPPNWLFPIAWTTLYVAIAVAAARVAPLAGNGLAMALWAAQIALNALWTPVFFGKHSLAGGVAVILPLWLAVAGLLVTFWGLDGIAGLLILPYLVWVSYAAALNIAVWRLNPNEEPLPFEV